MLLLVIAACVPQLSRAFLGRTPVLNVFYNVNVGVELLLLCLFFSKSFRPTFGRRIFYTTSLLCLLSGVVLIGMFGLKDKFLTEWLCINNLCYTAWILALLYDLYEDDKGIVEINTAQLYYIAGIFFYASCTILIFSLWEYIMTHRDSYVKNLWIIHDVFNILMYSSFTIGFLSESRRPITRTPK